MLKKIREMGSDIDRQWAQKDYKPQSFGKIASETLSKYELCGPSFLDEVLESLIGTTQIPRQHDLMAYFGEPPVTVFRNEKQNFVIEIFFWLTPEITIHDHPFEGAFTVGSGSSLQCSYEFTNSEKVDKRMWLGDIKLKHSEILRPGDVTHISSGTSFIHRVWHLTYPTVSILIKTVNNYELNYYPRTVNFFPPHVGIGTNPSTTELNTKRFQLMSFFKAIEHRNTYKFMQDLLKDMDCSTAFEAIKSYSLMSRNIDEACSLVESIKGRLGGWTSTFTESLRQELPVRRIRWDRLTNQDYRFLVALLLSFSDRKPIFNLMKQYDTKKDPADAIVGLLSEIVQLEGIGLKLPEISPVILKHLMKDVPPDIAAAEVIKNRSFGLSKRNLKAVEKLCIELKTLDLFAPLCTP